MIALALTRRKKSTIVNLIVMKVAMDKIRHQMTIHSFVIVIYTISSAWTIEAIEIRSQTWLDCQLQRMKANRFMTYLDTKVHFQHMNFESFIKFCI